MPFTTTIIFASTSFLLGLIFVCQTVDIPLLYRPQITPQAIQDATTFYGIWWEAPGACKAVLHTALGLNVIPLVWKLHKWTESAVFFDGSSLGESRGGTLAEVRLIAMRCGSLAHGHPHSLPDHPHPLAANVP